MKLPTESAYLPASGEVAVKGGEASTAPIANRSMRIESLNFPRLVVAVMIVAKHFYEGPYKNHIIWNRTGVCFFFVLHGFVVHFAKANRNWPLPPAGELPLLPTKRNLLRRFAALYPVHFLGVVSCALLKVFYRGDPLHVWQLTRELTFTAMIFPAHFNPTWYWYNEPLWFMNVMGWFWIFEEASFALVTSIWRTEWPITVMSAVFLAWNAFWNILRYMHNYVEGFPHVGLLPFRYFHQYWAGILLAMLVKDRMFRKAEPTKWMASLGLGLFLCLYVIDPEAYNLDTTDLLKRNGWLTPLMCMIIWGLAEGADPLAKACSNPSLFFYGDLAYAYYAMQSVTWKFLGDPPKPLSFLPYLARFALLFPTLFVVAYITNRYWQVPIRRKIEEWGKSLPT